MSTATTTAAKSDYEHERKMAAFKAKHFRTLIEQTVALGGKRDPNSILLKGAEALEAQYGLEPQIPDPVRQRPGQAKTGAASKPVATVSKPAASKPVVSTPVLPVVPVKSAADRKLEEMRSQLASKENELQAELAAQRAKLQAQHPGASAALVDEWITNKGGCRQTFCDDFKVFSAYRRNAS